MPQYLQNANLPRDPLDVGRLHNLFLLQGFDCDFFAGRGVHAEVDLSEGAFTQVTTCVYIGIQIL